MRIRRRHYDVLRALTSGPLDPSTLARRIDKTVPTACLLAQELGDAVASDGRTYRITDAGRELLAKPRTEP